MKGLIGLALLCPGVASAAGGAGCVGSYFTANGACVDAAATVAATATVGAGATVGDRALVGPGVDLGAGVFVGARAQLLGASPETTTQVIGANTVLGRRMTLGGDSVVGANNAFARAVSIG